MIHFVKGNIAGKAPLCPRSDARAKPVLLILLFSLAAAVVPAPPSARAETPPPPTSVSISSSAASVQIPDGKATITAVADRDLSGTGYSIGIFEGGTVVDGRVSGGTLVKSCSSGSACSYVTGTGWHENSATAEPRSRSFLAQIGRLATYNSSWSDVMGVAGPTTVTSTPVRTMGITIGSSAASVQIPDGKATITAVADRDLSGTGYSIGIFEGGTVVDGRVSGGTLVKSCSSGRICSYELAVGSVDGVTKTFRAQIGRLATWNSSWSDLMGVSGTVLVTAVEQPSIANVDAAAAAMRLALIAPKLIDPCIELFPVAPPSTRSSLNQAQEACEVARIGGQSWQQLLQQLFNTFGVQLILLADVAASDGGTVVGAPPREAPSQPDAPGVTPFAPRSPALDPAFANTGAERLGQRTRLTGYGTTIDPDPQNSNRQIYAQCVRLASFFTSGITPGDCDSKPIFAPGYDVEEATQHDFDVIVRTPSVMQLNQLSRTEKEATGVRFSWYDRTAYHGTCPQPRPLGADGQATNCDEYPFFSSIEGGPGIAGTLLPEQLRLINSEQNQLEGTILGGFYNRCGIAAAPQGNPRRQYLVIPMPAQSVIPTVAMCGRGIS